MQIWSRIPQNSGGRILGESLELHRVDCQLQASRGSRRLCWGCTRWYVRCLIRRHPTMAGGKAAGVICFVGAVSAQCFTNLGFETCLWDTAGCNPFAGLSCSRFRRRVLQSKALKLTCGIFTAQGFSIRLSQFYKASL